MSLIVNLNRALPQSCPYQLSKNCKVVITKIYNQNIKFYLNEC